MLASPKGYEYWTDNGISDDAPEWAKKEYEDYQNMIEQSIKPNEDKEIVNF
ncbi:hypothetical protein P7H38_07540 [Lactococcus raffinolactis]|jgi:hypothetical protein|uniref:hypothetical protein n=1 Tax=Pseudolactococcus raffinolactis TaxID=1366 RepID=UPI001436773B|nr:hypothetical protein [Lactococcus raffinolactis]MCH4162980.1 hypothetical protein [Lactococcus raffinolactis]MDT2766536.1 hypothetical protein [Lactococcus raffinolactis]MDT2789696.1 hypothetical protein [Lactococcus raffinolactis]